MNITSIISLLSPLAASGVNIGLTGQPGVGKTESIKAWAATLKASDIRPDLAQPGDEDRPVRFIPIATTTKESVDVSGLMEIKDGVTRWSPPAWVPVGNEACVVFLDEFPQAELPTQLAFQKLIDRDLDGAEVSPRALFIVAGNRLEDNAGANDIPMHIRNRFAWFEVESDVNSWVEWATENKVNKLVIDFIKARPTMLNRFDAKSKENAYATPRSVTRLASVLDNANPVTWLMLATSICGITWAAEFAQFCKLNGQIVSVEDCLDNADTCKLPTSFGVLNALVTALVRELKKDKSRIGSIVTIASRIDASGQSELAVKMLRDIYSLCPEMMLLPAAANLFKKIVPLLTA
jgi:hypothetical protein